MGLRTGAAYVIYGGAAPHPDVYLIDLVATDGFAILGEATEDIFGLSVSGAGMCCLSNSSFLLANTFTFTIR